MFSCFFMTNAKDKFCPGRRKRNPCYTGYRRLSLIENNERGYNPGDPAGKGKYKNNEKRAAPFIQHGKGRENNGQQNAENGHIDLNFGQK